MIGETKFTAPKEVSTIPGTEGIPLGKSGWAERSLDWVAGTANRILAERNAKQLAEIEADLRLEETLTGELRRKTDGVADAAIKGQNIERFLSSYLGENLPAALIENFSRHTENNYGMILDLVCKADFCIQHKTEIMAEIQRRFVTGPENDLAHFRKENAAALKKFNL